MSASGTTGYGGLIFGENQQRWSWRPPASSCCGYDFTHLDTASYPNLRLYVIVTNGTTRIDPWRAIDGPGLSYNFTINGVTNTYHILLSDGDTGTHYGAYHTVGTGPGDTYGYSGSFTPIQVCIGD